MARGLMAPTADMLRALIEQASDAEFVASVRRDDAEAGDDAGQQALLACLSVRSHLHRALHPRSRRHTATRL